MLTTNRNKYSLSYRFALLFFFFSSPMTFYVRNNQHYLFIFHLFLPMPMYALLLLFSVIVVDISFSISSDSSFFFYGAHGFGTKQFSIDIQRIARLCQNLFVNRSHRDTGWTWTLLALDKLVDSLNQSHNFLDHRVLTCWLRSFIIIVIALSKSFQLKSIIYVCCFLSLVQFSKSILIYVFGKICKTTTTKQQNRYCKW